MTPLPDTLIGQIQRLAEKLPDELTDEELKSLLKIKYSPTRPTPTQMPDTYVAGTLMKTQVKAGQTLDDIAQQYGKTVQEILAANPGLSAVVPGMTINIPQGFSKSPTSPLSYQPKTIPYSSTGTQTRVSEFPPPPTLLYSSTGTQTKVSEMPPGNVINNMGSMIGYLNNGQLPTAITENLMRQLTTTTYGQDLQQIYQKNPTTGNYELTVTPSQSQTTSFGKAGKSGGSGGSGIELLKKLAEQGQAWAQWALENQPWNWEGYNGNVTPMEWINAVYSELPWVGGGGGGKGGKGGMPKGAGSGGQSWGQNATHRIRNLGSVYPYRPPDYYSNRSYPSYSGAFGVVTWRV